jgi:hypothetical protein
MAKQYMYATVKAPAEAAIRPILTGTPKQLEIAPTYTKQSTEVISNRDTNTTPSNALRRLTLAGLSQRRFSRAAPIPSRNTLNPTQGLALSALATLASPPQLVANINAQTTLMVTPISLDTASSAELNINLALSEPSSAISALGGPATSSFVRQDLANTVANANVQTTVQVDSMKLFQVSSLSMDITHAQSAVPVPVVGWVYDSIFGTVPWMNDHLLAIQRQPKTIQNRAVVVVRAVVVPTAMDLGLSIPFRSEQISDPITSSSLRLSTLSETDNKWTEFHQQLMNCILRGENQCMTKIRLSKILDQE